jgi:type I restriction enzyme R subunit
LAAELLAKLLMKEIRLRMRSNVVQSRSFAQMLEAAVRKYQNRAIETAQVITELIELAKMIREAESRGEKLNLSEKELAFYDAMETNDSAVRVLGVDTLKAIAKELTDAVKNNASIDWNVRESARAKMRVAVKRVPAKYNYPPDKAPTAVATVVEQVELLTGNETTS